jgi:plasmid stabilization system protein ParE
LSRKVVFRSSAERDLAEAWKWYEEREAGLGARFLDSVEMCLKRISERPEGYPIASGEVRRALVGKFPYAVYFRMRGEHVRVLAVLHHRRGPRTLTARLR